MLCKRQHRSIETFPLAEICFPKSGQCFDKKNFDVYSYIGGTFLFIRDKRWMHTPFIPIAYIDIH